MTARHVEADWITGRDLTADLAALTAAGHTCCDRCKISLGLARAAHRSIDGENVCLMHAFTVAIAPVQRILFPTEDRHHA